jgi:diacylglycerol O-acyltransferase / wax synthase
MMRSLEPLSGADRAWLLMDRPTNPMVIVGLMILATPLRLAALRALISERFLSFERFRCLPIPETAAAHWQLSAAFDVDDHVLRAALPEPAGRAELEEFVSQLASTPLKGGVPLWTFHLVERYESGSALVVRIHHCYADGIALLRVLLGLAGVQAAGLRRASVTADRATPTEAVSGLFPGWIPGILQQGARALEKSIHYALHPLETTAVAREALGLGAALAQLAILPSDPPTRLKQPLSGIRRVAWADPLSLMEVATVGVVLGCTVNDVLVSVLAGALGEYLRAQGESTEGLTVRATVPVNLRTEEAAPSLGNRFGLVFVELPIGLRHPLERLYAVRAAMQALKHSPQAVVTLGLLSVVGSLPADVEPPLVELFTSKASLVASNLRGPAEPLYLAGARLSEALFWVPQAGSIGVGVSMLSYTGRVHFGVIADRQLIADPRALVEQVATQFERLVYLVLLGGGSLAS